MDIMTFGNKSFIAVKGLKERIEEAEKENQMREIKFRQPRLDNRGNFIDWFYWGLIDDGFIAPLRLNIDSYQFTGLKDKNGTEIYEEDIFRSIAGWKGTIIYNKGSFGHFDKIGQWLPLCTWASLDWFEIIGNVHTQS